MFCFGCGPDPGPASSPNFDALAASFGALSVAIAVGSILVTLLAIGITIAWNHSTQVRAVEAARVEARAEAIRFITSSEGRKLFEEGAATHLASASIGQGPPPSLPRGQTLGPLGNGEAAHGWFDKYVLRRRS